MRHEFVIYIFNDLYIDIDYKLNRSLNHVYLKVIPHHFYPSNNK